MNVTGDVRLKKDEKLNSFDTHLKKQTELHNVKIQINKEDMKKEISSKIGLKKGDKALKLKLLPKQKHFNSLNTKPYTHFNIYSVLKCEEILNDELSKCDKEANVKDKLKRNKGEPHKGK